MASLSKSNSTDDRGSLWNRWDSHIHTPLTSLANEYAGTSVEEFCTEIEARSPVIRALGITDYCGLGGYREVLEQKALGRLPKVDLIFPNVEFRLAMGTVKGSAINVHLLFSPEDAEHIERIDEFLARLSFAHGEDTYYCTRSDLVRLGKKFKQNVTDQATAYREGVNQFKIELSTLKKLIKRNDWLTKNCLIGIATGEGDGTSGLRTTDGGFTALRMSVESSAHFIFSAKPSDISFWLGNGADSIARIESEYGGLKPCLHGSDAHELAKVGKPNQDGFCWIKGALTFESLRQACIEPADRVAISSEEPRASLSNQTIESITVSAAPWMQPASIPLNPGLIAIIGARGSGKTALADFIAAGGRVARHRMDDRSFLNRASEFLKSSGVELEWESEEKTAARFSNQDDWSEWETPRVQYLSQQFVDALCSSDGMTGSLVEEVQRVIFDAHEETEREGASNFQELYDIRCDNAIQQRRRCENELSTIAEQLLAERLLKLDLPNLTKKKEELVKQMSQDDLARKKLVRPDQQLRLSRQEEVGKALQTRRNELEKLQKEARALKALQTDVTDYRVRRAPAVLSEFKANRAEVTFSPEQWAQFVPTISSSVDDLVSGRLTQIEQTIRIITGLFSPTLTTEQLQTPLIDSAAVLIGCTVNLLQAEFDRLGKLIGIDRQHATLFKQISDKMVASQKSVDSLEQQIKRIGEATENINNLIRSRRKAYQQVFEAIIQLETELQLLYGPLEQSLEQAQGALGKLQFVIQRHVDLEGWCAKGEQFLDLRKEGPFRGKGTLQSEVRNALEAVWLSGTPIDVATAIDAFMSLHADKIRTHRLDSMEPSEWNRHISEWLHSTDHITVEYGLQYGGVDIEHLSPGTRGIVLLLLYLAVDQSDYRPLIIDQPEENLDPQSVYDELVPRFRAARNRRQIIIVTHNANLVVNTDADQVIVASASDHQPGRLPTISYTSGGLENPAIRQSVCDILEGGRRAFEARARRLRLA